MLKESRINIDVIKISIHNIKDEWTLQALSVTPCVASD